MWKKEEDKNSTNDSNELASTFNNFNQKKDSSISSSKSASIGHTISIDGKITGDEDLTIQGKVKGEVKLNKNTLSVGRNGKVNASIFAKVVMIDGEVTGDISGSERVIINESGKVNGNIQSPRVILKDGSTFKGNIDMQSNNATDQKTAEPKQTVSNSSHKTENTDFNKKANINLKGL